MYKYAADFRISLRRPQIGLLEKGVAQVDEELNTKLLCRPSANAQRDFIQAYLVGAQRHDHIVEKIFKKPFNDDTPYMLYSVVKIRISSCQSLDLVNCQAARANHRSSGRDTNY